MTTEHTSPAELSLQKALLDLDAGRFEDAHRILTRLLRDNSSNPEVIFPLALVRYRLGYRVSADALFAQAFEHGHVFSDPSALTPVPDGSGHLHWIDPAHTVRLLLAMRPRHASMRLLKVEPAPPQS
jgi:hypothetical protein